MPTHSKNWKKSLTDNQTQKQTQRQKVLNKFLNTHTAVRRIIGLGETIMDIIFKNEAPTAAVPGGSVFNAIISLGRMKQNVTMISETGNDHVGHAILRFMKENGVSTENVNVFSDGRSAISLAWLDNGGDADYMFYKDYPNARLEVEWPEIKNDDIVMIGSYFVLNPVLRPKVREFLEYARNNGALIYYDLNFRKTHRADAVRLYADILENLDYADIVRGSTEDIFNIFGYADAEKVYKSAIEFHCKNMICTDAGGDVKLFTNGKCRSFETRKIDAVSTIGAGDNFNAGTVYGLVRHGVSREDLASLTDSRWDSIIKCGIDFATDVCMSYSNSVSKEFAETYIAGI